jgi:hypothetical protein
VADRFLHEIKCEMMNPEKYKKIISELTSQKIEGQANITRQEAKRVAQKAFLSQRSEAFEMFQKFWKEGGLKHREMPELLTEFVRQGWHDDFLTFFLENGGSWDSKVKFKGRDWLRSYRIAFKDYAPSSGVPLSVVFLMQPKGKDSFLTAEKLVEKFPLGSDNLWKSWAAGAILTSGKSMKERALWVPILAQTGRFEEYEAAERVVLSSHPVLIQSMKEIRKIVEKTTLEQSLKGLSPSTQKNRKVL